MKKLILAAAIVALGACSSSDDDNGISPIIDTGDDSSTAVAEGLQSVETLGNVPETIGALETSLNANDAISIVAQVDHQVNAANIGQELRPTNVTIFGNPLLGTPLMQINQLAGLDLPQKMLTWEDETGQSNIAYNSAEYLQGRHDLGDAPQLDTINTALSSLASNAAGQTLTPAVASAPESGEGVVVVPSANDMVTTFNNLRQSIDSAEALITVSIIDHSQNALDAGLSLPPTMLIIFGNPNLGTPLLQSGQSIGIDLPQKMLVFEDEAGAVSIAYNDPAYLAERHGISDQQELITTITGALANLAAGATTAP